MNKRLAILMLIVLCLGILVSCAKKEVEAEDSSRKTVKWQGIYRGVLPNYDNLGTFMELELNNDMTFVLGKKKQGTIDEIKRIKGTMTWSKDGNKLILESYSEVETSTILVKENKILWENINGIEYDEMYVSKHVLSKIPQGLLGNTWNINSINNAIVNVRPVDKNDSIYLSFSEKDNSINGFGGCNYFKVYYHLIDNDIQFMPVQATKMTGPNIEIENELYETLQKVRKIEIENGMLWLKDERGTNILIASVK